MWTIVLSVLLFLSVCGSFAAAVHAILYKRDTRSAIAWAAFNVFAPHVGWLLYVSLGVNRIRRRAYALRVEEAFRGSDSVMVQTSDVDRANDILHRNDNMR